MNQSKIKDFITQDITILAGVGTKTKKLLKKRKIEKISDLLWNFPQGYTDRSNVQTLDKLEIGKITTIKVKVAKYNFPRIKNLPSKVICEDKRVILSKLSNCHVVTEITDGRFIGYNSLNICCYWYWFCYSYFTLNILV